jgi:hypothetical protein
MSGGGFLKQGADSAKYNRSLLAKEPHKPFDRQAGSAKINLKFRDDIKEMSAQVEADLQREIITNNRRELRQRVASAIIALLILIGGLVAMFS